MSSKFWFPSMSVAEIVDAFTGWGYSVSPEQVARPTSDFVVGVYCACLEQVTGITLDTLQEAIDKSLTSTDNPDLYSGALAHNLLLYHIQRFANAAKINDFSSKDLYFPDPDRTRSIFSAFINFIKFSEQSEAFINRLREQSTAVIRERQVVTEEIQDLQEKIEEFKIKRAEDEPKCEALRQENTALMEQVIAYKEKQMGFLQDVEGLKQEKAALVAEKEKVTSEMETATDGISRTRSRIVQSPERIKRDIHTMGNSAAEEKRTVAANETKTRDLQAKIAALLNIEKARCSLKELGDLRDTLDRKKGERAELVMRRERVHKQFSNAQEKLERAQRHVEDKRLASQQTIERLQREYEEMAVERRDNDRQVEELRGEADEIERKMAEHMKTSQAELNELLTEYWKLRHETEVYMETLANKLGMHVRST
ncbi:hypothetical protein GSI_13459 [Ganoderma sinense ZZ0214-1]|uniref:Uncharacterized protein n=1 Tax=Ganoderma sinense ZZ0214-1 TaxID=1077348 RepID=A0A2G8RQB9_9APHY|nr:hypothetical protein GSI_13459 [Ganoderma sinense ZZ0214-1]